MTKYKDDLPTLDLDTAAYILRQGLFHLGPKQLKKRGHKMSETKKKLKSVLPKYPQISREQPKGCVSIPESLAITLAKRILIDLGAANPSDAIKALKIALILYPWKELAGFSLENLYK